MWVDVCVDEEGIDDGPRREREAVLALDLAELITGRGTAKVGFCSWAWIGEIPGLILTEERVLGVGRGAGREAERTEEEREVAAKVPVNRNSTEVPGSEGPVCE